MSHNSFGRLFKFTTFGESHGPLIGAVVDGCPPGIALDEADLQKDLDRRRPGQSDVTTQRKERDIVRIVSGVFEDESGVRRTTGTSIGLLIENEDTRSRDYDDIRRSFRPGHADWVYQQKYGIRDYRGGGRSSARETSMRVAAGAIARKVIPEVVVRGALIQMGEVKISRERWDWEEVNRNKFFCPDAEAAMEMERSLKEIRKSGNSVGAVIEVEATGVPAGWGAPVYGKLDADLASAMMSINAVKGVEIGAGFQSACLKGTENADEMFTDNVGNVCFSANHAGGILGGISTSQPIVCRFAVKPTSSILLPRKSIDVDGQPVDVVTKGRHDPCVGIRAVAIGEAMMAVVLADHFLRHRAQCGFSNLHSVEVE